MPSLLEYFGALLPKRLAAVKASKPMGAMIKALGGWVAATVLLIPRVTVTVL